MIRRHQDDRSMFTSLLQRHEWVGCHAEFVSFSRSHRLLDPVRSNESVPALAQYVIGMSSWMLFYFTRGTVIWLSTTFYVELKELVIPILGLQEGAQLSLPPCAQLRAVQSRLYGGGTHSRTCYTSLIGLLAARLCRRRKSQRRFWPKAACVTKVDFWKKNMELGMRPTQILTMLLSIRHRQGATNLAHNTIQKSHHVC